MSLLFPQLVAKTLCCFFINISQRPLNHNTNDNENAPASLSEVTSVCNQETHLSWPCFVDSSAMFVVTTCKLPWILCDAKLCLWSVYLHPSASKTRTVFVEFIRSIICLDTSLSRQPYELEYLSLTKTVIDFALSLKSGSE